MSRILATVSIATLVLSSSVVGQNPEVVDWSKMPEWKEVSLDSGTGSKSVYRQFLWTPFWGQAVARLTVEPDGTGELATKVRDYREPHTITGTYRKLDSGEVSTFLSALRQADFWSLVPMENDGKRYKDADLCTLEALDEGKYHAVRRAVPGNSRFVSACEYFVREALRHPAG